MADLTGLEKVGLGFIGFVAFSLLKKICVVIYNYKVGPAINAVDFKSKGKWAIVTGATDGIGKEYARQLAEKGCNIILVSRTLAKLNEVAKEIENEFKVETKVIQADFTAGDEIYEHIAKEIKDLDIGTLVNNVGLYYKYPEYFLDIPDFEKFTRDITNANCIAVIRMSKLVLPQMVKKGKGVIINVSSSLAEMNCPLVIIYNASKTFVDTFTVGLQQEYNNSGVIIQSLLTGAVQTKLSGLAEDFMTPTPDKYVRAALSSVGTESRTTGFFPHTLGFVMFDTIKSISSSAATAIGRKFMEKNRSDALKKL